MAILQKLIYNKSYSLILIFTKKRKLQYKTENYKQNSVFGSLGEGK